jgi:hypothetical protein
MTAPFGSQTQTHSPSPTPTPGALPIQSLPVKPISGSGSNWEWDWETGLVRETWMNTIQQDQHAWEKVGRSWDWLAGCCEECGTGTACCGTQSSQPGSNAGSASSSEEEWPWDIPASELGSLVRLSLPFTLPGILQLSSLPLSLGGQSDMGIGEQVGKQVGGMMSGVVGERQGGSGLTEPGNPFETIPQEQWPDQKAGGEWWQFAWSHCERLLDHLRKRRWTRPGEWEYADKESPCVFYCVKFLQASGGASAGGGALELAQAARAYSQCVRAAEYRLSPLVRCREEAYDALGPCLAASGIGAAYASKGVPMVFLAAVSAAAATCVTLYLISYYNCAN